MNRFFTFILVAILILCSRTQAKDAAAREPATPDGALAAPAMPDEKTLPFDKPDKGLACRAWVPGDDFCHGQPIPLAIEIKNVSDHDLYVADILNPQFTQWIKLTILGPAGKPLKQGSSATTSLQPAAFTLLSPGKTRQFHVANLRDYFYSHPAEDPFGITGNFVLTYQFTAPKLPEQTVIGERGGPNGREKIFAEPTPDQKKFAWTGVVKSNIVNFKIVAPRPKDLTIHEWGVFTVFNDSKFANLNRKAEWSTLPEFFYRQFPTQRLKWVPAAWDKPIVYVYTDRPALRLEMKVKFANGGAPVAWWPCAAEPLNSGMSPRGEAIDPTVKGGRRVNPKPFDYLKWDLQVGPTIQHETVFGGSGAGAAKIQAKLADLPENSWLKTARLPDAALVTASGTSIKGGRPWQSHVFETEGFVFYDGLVPAPNYLRCTAIEANAITVRNSAPFEIPYLFLVDRRSVPDPSDPMAKQRLGSPRVRIGYASAKVEAGEELKISFGYEVDPKEFVAQVREQLLDAGLFVPEADTLLKIWNNGLLENTGVVAFYLLPADEYNRMLPLETRPIPAKPPIRVGVAFHPNFDAGPSIADRTAKLITQLDADDFKTREQAKTSLIQMGPIVIPAIRSALRSNPSETAQSLMHQILQQVDASDWLK